LLGGAYFHSGEVVQDQGLGRKIGFPTVNLKLDPKTSILYGVYLTSCLLDGVEYKGISNIGFRPTVSSGDDKMVLETHILDSSFPEVKSGAVIRISFKEFIRAEQKFVSIEDLRTQIEADVRFAQSR
ncbi:MAG: riboflavin kinase, partial [Bdellovibrionales bacterium]